MMAPMLVSENADNAIIDFLVNLLPILGR